MCIYIYIHTLAYEICIHVYIQWYKDKQAKYTIMGYNQSTYCILNFWVGTAIEKLLPAKPEERQRKDKVKQLAALIKGCVPDRKLEHVLILPEKAANLSVFVVRSHRQQEGWEESLFRSMWNARMPWAQNDCQPSVWIQRLVLQSCSDRNRHSLKIHFTWPCWSPDTQDIKPILEDSSMTRLVPKPTKAVHSVVDTPSSKKQSCDTVFVCSGDFVRPNMFSDFIWISIYIYISSKKWRH